jgi:hypothetical protein
MKFKNPETELQVQGRKIKAKLFICNGLIINAVKYIFLYINILFI